MLQRLVAETQTYLGRTEQSFRCCDTDFTVHVRGRTAERAAIEARQVARSLESQLNAFDWESAVARLNREGVVTNQHVAAIVERGLEYAERTAGVFDVRYGTAEHELKAYLREETDEASVEFEAGSVTVDGATVRADRPLDLNGLAKGYVVDRTFETITGLGRSGFVSGGGDIARPTGPVGIESPYGDSEPLKVLDTDWNVATSAGYERRRGDVDHLYNPVAERVGTSHDLVTVVAERDCMEADALATTLAALPTDHGIELANEWQGVEALVVHQGVFHRTEGFTEHVYHA